MKKLYHYAKQLANQLIITLANSKRPAPVNPILDTHRLIRRNILQSTTYAHLVICEQMIQHLLLDKYCNGDHHPGCNAPEKGGSNRLAEATASNLRALIRRMEVALYHKAYEKKNDKLM